MAKSAPLKAPTQKAVPYQTPMKNVIVKNVPPRKVC